MSDFHKKQKPIRQVLNGKNHVWDWSFKQDSNAWQKETFEKLFKWSSIKNAANLGNCSKVSEIIRSNYNLTIPQAVEEVNILKNISRKILRKLYVRIALRRILCLVFRLVNKKNRVGIRTNEDEDYYK